MEDLKRPLNNGLVTETKIKMEAGVSSSRSSSAPPSLQLLLMNLYMVRVGFWGRPRSLGEYLL